MPFQTLVKPSLPWKVSAALSSYLLVGFKGFLKDLEANPKDSGDKYRRLLDKPLAYFSGPWMAGLFIR